MRECNDPAAVRNRQAAEAQQAAQIQIVGQGEAVPAAFTIGEHMEVYASCGTRIGRIDNVEGKLLKLTKSDSQAGGKHHFIPIEWVDHVDEHVHLKKDSEDVMRDWTAETIGTTG
jgi:hypothetical protein